MIPDPQIPVFKSPELAPIARLFRIASRDALTKAYISAWQAGDFPSFETMLISLACVMYEQKMEYEKRLIHLMENHPRQ